MSKGWLVSPPPEPELTERFCHEFSHWLAEELVARGERVVMATVHGSYLYGTAHQGSDVDGLVVIEDTPGAKNKTLSPGNLDVQVLTMKTYVRLLGTGSHQSVEACTSPYRVFTDSPYAPMVAHLRYNPSGAVARALSAAKSFRAQGEKEGSEKKLRHAQRLEDSAAAHLGGTYTPVYQWF